MCTSVAMNIGGFYFGRNMDLEGSFGECVVMVPRHFPFSFRKMPEENCHYALIGMAAVSSGYPLFADAMNENGLCMAGLNFPGNAVYQQGEEEAQNCVTPFELIPWVLGRCATVNQAERLLSKTRLVAIPFSDAVPLTPLHWHLARRSRQELRLLQRVVSLRASPSILPMWKWLQNQQVQPVTLPVHLLL